MHVKDHHNFSVNGGLIVHNSIDDVRYALEADMGKKIVRSIDFSIGTFKRESPNIL